MVYTESMVMYCLLSFYIVAYFDFTYDYENTGINENQSMTMIISYYL